MYIDGEWVPRGVRPYVRGDEPGDRRGHGHRPGTSAEPATGQVMAVPTPAADVDRVRRPARLRRGLARRHRPGARPHPLPPGRGGAEGGQALAELETLNSGKPLAESEYDINDVATCFEYYGGLATKLHGEVLNVPDNALSLALREPLGVAGQIIPWNYPLLMAAWKIAPALCAGCTDGHQARGADAAHAAGAGALVRGLRRAEGRGQRDHRLRRGGGGAAGGARRGGQDRVHGQRRGGQADHALRGRHPEEGQPGAGRQVAQHLLRRRRLRVRGGRRALRRLHQPGRGVLGGQPRAGAAAHLQEDARRDGGEGEAHQARLRAWTPPRRWGRSSRRSRWSA